MRCAVLAARETNATTQVVTAPISTYHVNAIGVAHHTAVITIRPAIMPGKRVALADRRRERAEQERAEHRSRRKRQHREAGIEHRSIHELRADRHRQLHDAPGHRRLLRDAHLRGLIGGRD